MTETNKYRSLGRILKTIGFLFLGLIYLACLYLWWNYDLIGERYWLGELPLVFSVIVLNLFYVIICTILLNFRKVSDLLFVVLLVIFPLSEWYTYHLLQNPFDSYFTDKLQSVSNINLPENIEIISKKGKRPDINGHYFFILTAKLKSSDYMILKESILKSKNFNDTTELILSDAQKHYWNVNSNKLSQSLRILNVNGHLTVNLIDNENVMVFIYSDM
jgi:hypothetical protein